MAQENEVDRGDVFEAPTPAENEVEKELETKAEEETPETETLGKPVAEGKKQENLIPQSRFNEAVLKERARTEAAVARVKELEGKVNTQEVAGDFEQAYVQMRELIKQRNGFLSDGKLDEAGQADEQILVLQDAIGERKAEIKASQAKEVAKEEMRYDSMVEKLEELHPELDPDNEAYNQEAVDEVRILSRGYQVEMGLAPSVALARAAKRVFGETVRAAPTPSKAAETGLNRKKEATARAIDAVKKSPASTKEVGLDHDKRGGGLDAKTVMTMSYKEFSELSDEVLAKMRGDSL
jgi:hypothetical protein